MSQKIKICWEAINRTCEAAKIKKTKKRKVSRHKKKNCSPVLQTKVGKNVLC